MSVPLVDLVAQYRAIRQDIDRAIRAVVESGMFILGPNVAGFEEEIAAYLGVRHAVGVASGTDALLLTLRAYGIGAGDEVIVPAYTFFATAEAVSQAGATPVFVDIDPETYCLDVARLAAAITPRTKAMIPVHLYGHPADMAPILDLAGRPGGVKVIEDNAQAIGAEYQGRKTGSLGDAACLSFYPTKNLGGYGDGGMIVTSDARLAETVRSLRTHGWRRKDHPEAIGYNSRLDELQAAVLRAKLPHLERWNERRRWIAARYRALLAASDVGIPEEAPDAKHVYHLYVLRLTGRDAVREHLSRLGIATGVYYPEPLHRLEPYRQSAGSGTFVEAERASRETLAIPVYPELTDVQIDAVAAGVREGVKVAATFGKTG